jgi:hypothetical protein
MAGPRKGERALPEQTLTTDQDSDFPRTWRFDKDGLEVSGRYVEIGEGTTANGPCPIVVLNADGEHRSIWLFHTAVRNRFADEVARRKDGDLTQGELVVIRQGETKESGGGRSYVSYSVRFPEAPKRSPKEILGETEPVPEPDDAPF